MNPPDGHWHRRTAAPVETTPKGERVYGCTEKGCTWRSKPEGRPAQPVQVRS